MSTVAVDGEHPALRAITGIDVCLDDLESSKPLSMSAAECARLVVELERVARRLDAARVAAAGQADAMSVAEREGATSLSAWLRAVADVAPGVTKSRVELQRDLADLPETAQAFRAGDISMAGAEAICSAMHSLPAAIPDDLTGTVERLLIDTARDDGTRAVVRRAEEICHRFDPDGLERAEAAQAEANRLRMSLRHDGTVHLRGVLDREAGALAFKVLGAHAAPLPAARGEQDHRDAEARYAEAFVHVLRVAAESSPSARGERPHLLVGIDLKTLRGGVAGTPGTLLDTGANICATTARRLACDANIIPVVLGSQSQPLDVGRSTRLVPKPLRHALNARDRGCAMPGCDRPPSWCDAHHLRPWYHGGATNISNLCLLCEKHHGVVHRQGWQIEIREGLPWFTPPAWLDRERRPRLHSRHRTRDLGP